MDEIGTETIVALIDSVSALEDGALAFFDNKLVTTSSGLNWDTSNQTLAIGNETPNIEASLDIGTTAGPILLPRYTSSQRDAISAVDGMMIYNTTTSGFQGYAAGAWVNLH